MWDIANRMFTKTLTLNTKIKEKKKKKMLLLLLLLKIILMWEKREFILNFSLYKNMCFAFSFLFLSFFTNSLFKTFNLIFILIILNSCQECFKYIDKCEFSEIKKRFPGS